MKVISGLEFLKEIENKNIKENTTYTIIDNEKTWNKTKIIFNGYDCDPIFEYANSHNGNIDINWFINTTVEIIGEDKDIEELEIENDSLTHFYIRDEFGTKCSMTKHSKLIADKVNELVKEVNKLKKRGRS